MAEENKKNNRIKIKSPKEIKEIFPLSGELQERILKDRQEIKNILEGLDKRKILIIGPCSAWPKKAVLEYAQSLKNIEEKVSDKIKIIMRVYTQKPRTAMGWSGPLFQSDPFSVPDVEKGILYVRETMIKILELGLPVADEALFLESGAYLNDIYSYVALGARSVEDHAHRVYASALPFAVGVKNPSSGDIETAKNSVLAVSSKHTFLSNGQDGFEQVDSNGNKYGHLVLRGGYDGPNYHKKDLEIYLEKMKEVMDIPSCVVDINHSNSGKNPLKQPEILKEVLESISDNKELGAFVKGFMMESFLEDGNQSLDKCTKETCNMKGLSVTDGCLGLQKTEKMVEEFYKAL